MPALIAGLWRRIVDIRTGEAGPTLAMAGLYFLVLGAASLVKPVRQSAFLDAAGAQAYPFVLLGTALVVGVLMAGYARIAERVRTAWLLLGTYLFLASNLVVFWWLFRLPALASPGRGQEASLGAIVTSAGFFIWAAIYSVLTVSQFWLLGNLVFDARQAKRLFGFVGAGGIVGAIVGSWATGVLAKIPAIGRVNIVLLAAAVLAMAAGLAAWVLRRTHAAPSPPRKTADQRLPAGAATLVRQSPHLKAVATILLVIIVVSAIADQQLNSAVDTYVPRGDARTAFFGQYFAVTNVISLVVQLFVTSYVLRRFGVAVALLLLPTAMLATSVGLLLAPSLLMAAVVRGADQSLRYSLDQSTRELLFLPVPAEIKTRVKPFIDVAVQRSGKGISALIILVLLTWLGVPFQYLGIVSLVAIGLWGFRVVAVKREYVMAIKRMIQVRDVEVDELVVRQLDADSRRELAVATTSADPETRRFALELLRVAGEERPDERLVRKLQYPSVADVGERAEAVRARIAEGGVTRTMAMEFLADPIPRVRAGAVAGLLDHGDADIRGLAEAALWQMAGTAGASGAPVRREAALIIASLPSTRLTMDVLRQLLRDDAPPVRKAALVAAGQLGRREFLPAMLEALADPALRDDTRTAIAPLAARSVGSLGDVLRDPGEPTGVRIQAARLLAGIPGPLTAAVLSAALDDGEAEIRYHALKSLNRLRRSSGALTVDSAVVEAAIERERQSLLAMTGAAAELAAVAAGGDGTLLRAVLHERRDDALERLLRALGLVYPLDDMLHAYRAVRSGHGPTRTSGVDLLDNVLSPAHRRTVVPLFEDSAHAAPAAAPAWRTDRWLATCAAHAAARAASGSAPIQGLPPLEAAMTSILDRAEFLRKVEFLSLVRTEYLAKIAAVMHEETTDAGKELIAQGGGVDRVHLIASGRVVARRDGQILFISSSGDAVGVLSVLDGKPSPFAAVAMDRTTLLTLGAEDFNDLIQDNSAIMLGLLRYLAGQVRELSGRARQAGASTTIS